jgi:hypothetical protein
MFHIYFIYEYHDGPIQGIADAKTGPCFFELEFSEDIDDFTDVAKLYSIAGYDIDPSLLDEIPDYPLPENLRDAISNLVSDIENGKLSYETASAQFSRVKKGTNSDSFTVEWLEIKGD